MNPSWERLQKLGIHTERSSSFFHYIKAEAIRPTGLYCQRLQSSCPRNHQRFGKYPRRNFGLKNVRMECKLALQNWNTTHHPVLIFHGGAVVGNADKISQMLLSELLTSECNRDLHELVKTFNIHQNSPYCRGRIRNGQCLVEYDTNEANITTFIVETCNRVVYRRI